MDRFIALGNGITWFMVDIDKPIMIADDSECLETMINKKEGVCAV